MKPTKKGKKKQSKYSSYIEENDTFVNRILSSPGKKLIAYVTFFSVFAVIFFTALRNSKHPEALDYELDLEFPDSREQNLIDETILDVDDNALRDNAAVVDVEVDEIDILDSDDGELQLAGSDEKEGSATKEATTSGEKAKGKGKAKAQAGDKAKAAKAPAAKKAKGSAKQKDVKETADEEASEDYVVSSPVKQNKGRFDDAEFSEELKGMLSSGNNKLRKEKTKKDKQNHEKHISDKDLVEKMDELEAEKTKGRKKNAYKGENL